MEPRQVGTMRAMPAPAATPWAPAAPVALAASRSAASSPPAGRPVAAARSLAHQLERDRLEQRAVRVRQVIRALRERAAARDGLGGAPRPLRAAIDDFGHELAELERRLHQHRHPGLGR